MIFRENLKRAALVWTVVIGHSTTLMAEVFEIFPGDNAEEALQESMILASPGDEIVIAEGIYSIKNQLSLAVDDLTITGAGMDKTILNFASQIGGSEGFLVTGNGAILRDFAIEDTKGDAIKSKGVDGIGFVRMRVEWTGGPDVNNGAYGFYPVSSRNVLLDGVVAIGASDAGIYVGQSTNIIARNSQAAFNVAGLEIENCHFADVYNNVLTDNTGGILVFDLPDIPQQGGHHVRVFNNRSFANNTTNFAPEGNIVGLVPAGTGVLIMANSDVEVFDNVIENNQTVGILFGSYIKRRKTKITTNIPAAFTFTTIHLNKMVKIQIPENLEVSSMPRLAGQLLTSSGTGCCPYQITSFGVRPRKMPIRSTITHMRTTIAPMQTQILLGGLDGRSPIGSVGG